ncbi:hypothetical protein [Actinacidiphila epipremni]|uniref:Uncharacterized protein n=1 Tax=Actinacidiphila epipremni TaxID=2053013 RepID=A0ABX0ZL68_9ACTN|nr:hypothetical protein [Actinacidiphila epipremni]NJP44598.1 hypothetical protein [Actinacidiphila epipremni]
MHSAVTQPEHKLEIVGGTTLATAAIAGVESVTVGLAVTQPIAMVSGESSGLNFDEATDAALYAVVFGGGLGAADGRLRRPRHADAHRGGRRRRPREGPLARVRRGVRVRKGKITAAAQLTAHRLRCGVR